MTTATGDGGELVEHVADALLVLANVGYGDLDSQVPIRLDPDTPLGALFEGINVMIDALRAERDRSHSYRAELEEKLATIEQQRAAIRELSTPVIEVWEGVLCLPIVGIVDSARASQMTDVLLQQIVDKRTHCAIVDITGIDAMDTRTVDHFVRMARAVRLLGAECVLTGVSQSIAHTVVHMGIDFRDVVTHRSLREALQAYVLSSRTKKVR
jgi:rsbT co-antagonist protein RsbR